jgi:hypothetical protein
MNLGSLSLSTAGASANAIAAVVGRRHFLAPPFGQGGRQQDAELDFPMSCVLAS